MQISDEPTSALSIRTPIATSIAIILIMAIFSWFSLWQTVREANQADRERTHLAVSNAVTDQQKRLADLVFDNAEWDDAARAVYRRPIDQEFIKETWESSTSQSGLFDHLMIVDANGRVVAAFENGKASGRDYRGAFGKSFAEVQRQAFASDATVAGTVRVGGELRFVAATRIRPHNPQNAQIGAGATPMILVLSRRFEGEVVSEFSKKLVLNGLQFSSVRTADSVAIFDPADRTLGWISWDANLPGNKAIVRSLPWMVGGILICLLLVGLLARFGMQALSEMNRSALFDGLSHLPNRRSLRIKLGEALANREAVALAIIDLDGFKDVNDNFGHAVGDALVQRFSLVASEAAGQRLIVARLGGDEFAMLATGPQASTYLDHAIDNLLERLSKPFQIDDCTIYIGASIGMASGGGLDITMSDLLNNADFAMYQSKRAGKMRKTWFSATGGKLHGAARVSNVHDLAQHQRVA